MDKTVSTENQFSGGSALAVLRKVPLVYYALVALLIFAAVTEPRFFGQQNATNVIKNSTALGIVTIGQTITMLVAGIDLSLGAVMSLTTVVSALLMQQYPEYTIPIVLLCLLIGTVIGFINGVGVAYFNLNPLILTLATGTTIQGVSLHILYSPDGLVTRGFREISRGTLGPIPYPAIYLLVLYLVGTYILRRTGFGLKLYATGGNEASARLSGIRTRRVKLSAYVISGFLASVGGLYLVSLIVAGDPLSGEFFTLDSITAAVLGGTSLFGGEGGLLGGLAGVFILGIVSTLLNWNNVSPFYQWVIKGAILIGALGMSYLGKREKN